jgi:4-hydroxy-tetrahydrodipicolinate synthase
MFHGSMVALVTPMTDDGDIDYKHLNDLMEWHIAEGTQALVIAGTTGESATLTHDEKVTLYHRAVEIAKERVPVIVGAYGESTQDAIAMGEAALHAGADATLVMTPAYIKPTQEGLFQHYKAIAHEVAIPLIVYNVPSRTACDLLPETLARLADIPNIIGIKEATGSMERLQQILDLCGERIDVYSGDDLSACDLMLGGGKGLISVTANVVPKLMAQLCAAALAGDADTAKALDARLQPLHKALFLEANPIPVKWLVHKIRGIPANIRLPMTPFAEQYHKQLWDIATPLARP